MRWLTRRGPPGSDRYDLLTSSFFQIRPRCRIRLHSLHCPNFMFGSPDHPAGLSIDGTRQEYLLQGTADTTSWQGFLVASGHLSLSVSGGLPAGFPAADLAKGMRLRVPDILLQFVLFHWLMSINHHLDEVSTHPNPDHAETLDRRRPDSPDSVKTENGCISVPLELFKLKLGEVIKCGPSKEKIAESVSLYTDTFAMRRPESKIVSMLSSCWSAILSFFGLLSRILQNLTSDIISSIKWNPYRSKSYPRSCG